MIRVIENPALLLDYSDWETSFAKFYIAVMDEYEVDKIRLKANNRQIIKIKELKKIIKVKYYERDKNKRSI